MTSVQSWLLLPSSWCEDEHFYSTPLDQGSEQPLFQPLDHQATSLPSRGERALCQVGCTPTCTAFCSFVTSCKCSEDQPRRTQPSASWACKASCRNTCCRFSVLWKAWSLRCPFTASNIASLFLSWVPECFLKIRWQSHFYFHRWSQEFQSTEIGVLMALAKSISEVGKSSSVPPYLEHRVLGHPGNQTARELPSFGVHFVTLESQSSGSV